MGTPIHPSMFEILREIGIEPGKAHAFDRALEQRNQEVHEVIDQRLKDFANKQDLENGLTALRTDLKAEMASLKADLLKSMNDMQRWIITTFLGTVGLTVVVTTTVVKLL